ncbi:ribosomal protein L27 [Polytolypa hystricis UAMH7299]|uniref:Large ribosomal subunit protein bL27m n=1 Tax=Polytolypa hystricis (strain UAMH7299) TaxID=1447883 RepID=A0A2B7XLG7_POLH7|nr:ribosomal protein L27 [Polytolypa hystricis UAMH7299]
MLQPKFRAPLRVLDSFFSSSLRRSQLIQSRIPSAATANSTITKPSTFLQQPYLSLLPRTQVRYASHATQGAANSKSKNTAGRRLGAKKTGDQYVIPGNIIFRQRGSKWFPGENCGMGRDHTIFAREAGYVKYYKDPGLHPDKRYIGVALCKEDKFPLSKSAPRKRRLNMAPVPRQVEEEEGSGVEVTVVNSEDGKMPPKVLTLRPGYMYREANWQIGRVAEKAGITVKEWKRKDRWTAWRKKHARAKRAALQKDLKSRKKKAKAKK